jgi:hypothetical protein
MFSNIALTGVWLAGGLALAILVGMFAAQYVKDLVKGVPSTLRTALKQTEANALAALKAAEQKAIMDVTGLLPAAKAAAPVAAAPAAAPAAAVVQPAAPKAA